MTSDHYPLIFQHPDGEYVSIRFSDQTSGDTLLKVGGQHGPAGWRDKEIAAEWAKAVDEMLSAQRAVERSHTTFTPVTEDMVGVPTPEGFKPVPRSEAVNYPSIEDFDRAMATATFPDELFQAMSTKALLALRRVVTAELGRRDRESQA